MELARGGDTLAAMALQSINPRFSQKGPASDQAAERMLVLLPEFPRPRKLECPLGHCN